MLKPSVVNGGEPELEINLGDYALIGTPFREDNPYIHNRRLYQKTSAKQIFSEKIGRAHRWSNRNTYSRSQKTDQEIVDLFVNHFGLRAYKREQNVWKCIFSPDSDAAALYALNKITRKELMNLIDW